MYLVQVLLPFLAPSDGDDRLRQVRDELAASFGGVTFYRNNPAEGLWQDDGRVEKDDIVVAEIMVDDLGRAWWSRYRQKLERRFDQDEIVARAVSMTRL